MTAIKVQAVNVGVDQLEGSASRCDALAFNLVNVNSATGRGITSD
jgi:hypothetical protein